MARLRMIVVLAAGVLAANVVFAGDRFPEWRGADGQGRADAVNVPVTWSETENVA